MEIIVEGKSVKYFVPDEVIININFSKTCLTYNEALIQGVESVQHFIKEILLKNKFKMEDMKTRSMIIREEKKYNDESRSYEHKGYSFNQSAILKFDYDKELIAKIMEDIAQLEDGPMCYVKFKIKDIEECRKEMMTSAYKDAEAQALIIAESAGKTLKYCQKVDFKPFNTEYISDSSFDTKMMCVEKKAGVAQTILNTFTPEDVELKETLYCLWIAE